MGLARRCLGGVAMLAAVAGAGVPCARAGTEQTIYNFKGGTDGATPLAALLEGEGGSLYGTAAYGGNLACAASPGLGCGLVFRLDPPAAPGAAWKLVRLHAFLGLHTETVGATQVQVADGLRPAAELIADGKGVLYGTTEGGGSGGCTYSDVGPGCGTVFRLAGTALTVLHSFTALADGAIPKAGLVMDPAGNLYGTTQLGGTSFNCGGGCGTVFRLAPPAKAGAAWTETVLYTFQGQADGQSPQAALLLDGSGVLYGRNRSVVFSLTPPAAGTGAWSFATLYPLATSVSGVHQAGLTWLGPSLIGVTSNGGAVRTGSVFRLTPPAAGATAWAYDDLFDFGKPGSALAAGQPQAGVVADPSGALYGAIRDIVFKLSPPAAGKSAWTPSVVYRFAIRPFNANTAPLGDDISASLVRDGTGSLFGTTVFGGKHGDGGIFAVQP